MSRQMRFATALVIAWAATVPARADTFTNKATDESGPASQPKPASGPTNVVEFNPLGGEQPMEDDVDEGLLVVVATGVGVNEDKAMQNAFANAIEQAVGVMVDAEALVKNDELVSDKILTFSRGFINKYTVVRRWKADALAHVKIRAFVSRGKLAGRLAEQDIATRAVPGELLYYQTMNELASDQAAAEMFRHAMKGFTLDKLFEVRIVGKPEKVAGDDVHATIKVTYRLVPNFANWQKIFDTATPVLQKIALKRTTFLSGDEARRAAAEKLAGDGILISVVRKFNKTGQISSWDGYLVPKSLLEVVRECYTQPCELHIALAGEDDRPIAETEQPVPPRPERGQYTFGYHHPFECIGPHYWWSAGSPIHEICSVITAEQEFKVELSKLKDINKCVVYIKNVSPLDDGEP